MDAQVNKGKVKLRNIKLTVLTIGTTAVVLAAFYVMFNYVFKLRVVPTESMVPTVESKDITIANGMAYKKKKALRYEVVLIDSKEEGKELVKRVIGVPGDEISFADGRVYVNGQLLEEPYLDDLVVTQSDKTFKVPSGSYFVLGDNRANSTDSLDWDNPYVEEEEITGQVFCSIGAGGGIHIHFF